MEANAFVAILRDAAFGQALRMRAEELFTSVSG
jgi:hypothetical protein